MRLYRSPKEQGTGFLRSSVAGGAQIPQFTAGSWSTNPPPQDKVTAGGEVAGPLVTWTSRAEALGTNLSWQHGLQRGAIAAALSLAETGLGLAAPAAALTAVAPHCSSYSLALLFLPPPSFVPRAAVDESREGINVPGSCVSSWLEAPLLCSWLLIQPSPSAKHLEELVCTLHFKNEGEVASDHTSLFCLAKPFVSR